MMNRSNKSFSLQSLLLLQLLNFCIFIIGEAVPPYIPIENISINCGSFSDSIAWDGRLWSGESNSKFPVINSQNKLSVFLNASTGHVPYITGRLSYSEFSYIIPLTSGQKFIRLHFHVNSYPEFNLSKAFFSVKAGPFTLLRNFSALLHAQGEETLVKEFCVSIQDGQNLNITFTPSSAITDAYAFINGIEIVSMPANLFYRPANDAGVSFLGQSNLYSFGNDTALEMFYRLSVGGMSIPPTEDTGMYRAWSDDFEYITSASYFTVNNSINLTFSAIPSFSAPESIYRTARVMGPNRTFNEHSNLTWQFPVDSDFDYFVRLHFCEMHDVVAEPGDRVFVIFIANLTAESQADVIAWSGGSRIPKYRDYVVAIKNKGNQKKQNLSIKLHPALGRYIDAILNGVEIFKLSKGGDLSGPNPDPMPNLLEPMKPPIEQSGKKWKIIVAVVGLISTFAAASLLFFLILRIRSSKFANKSSRALPSDICRHFSLREIKAATNNFDENFIIGRGGFGNVYKGFINAGSIPVAIKRLNPGSQQGVLEFRTEIEMLSQLRHQNLVSLMGYCKDNNEMILVYDYMVHGTLRDHLYNTNNPPLQWEKRLKMCIAAAQGLHYLHRGPKDTIIHRDVKTTNILLSEKWVAKVSDFGLSKMNDLSNTHISTAVKGSFGYLDPEYFRLQQLTEKSDVYSFGVVLCEVLCARAPIDRAMDHLQISLAEWAQHCYNNGTLDQIMDPYLQGKINLPSLLKFGEVAMSCLATEGIKRPAMSEVVCGLELALQLQESGINGNDENHVNDSTVIDYHVLFTSGSGSLNVGR
ncbi:receptor-like protein kinase FERONIA [Durio zibethinus]|uniref:Receptor-like protein kinase FERONIA n=1 Tax=Durio zibethinus TaxID=66656 RepID=A0A6P5ZMH8_DURZI|nr:receptor-like protein kinase FERONIA [Durio zibethinus]